jgi:hypothetical protein
MTSESGADEDGVSLLHNDVKVGPHTSLCAGSAGHGSHAATADCLDEAVCMLPLSVIDPSLGDRPNPMINMLI